MVMVSHRKERMNDIRKMLRRKNAAAGLIVANRAKELAPVDTGLLRASIESRSTDSEVTIGVSLAEVPYARFQELGTRRNNPHPYLVPGILSSKPALQAVYGGKRVDTNLDPRLMRIPKP